jgi:glycoprotein endo-alpha-1,2-mannosidase
MKGLPTMRRGIRQLVALLAAVLALPASGLAAPARSAIFFYPWYSNPSHDGAYSHWQQGAHTPPFDVASDFFPARGAYSSADPRILRAQMRDIRQAGIDEVVSSWWGWGSDEDLRLPAVLRAAHGQGLSVAVHIEPYAGRSIETIGSDLVHLRALGILRLQGR